MPEPGRDLEHARVVAAAQPRARRRPVSIVRSDVDDRAHAAVGLAGVDAGAA